MKKFIVILLCLVVLTGCQTEITYTLKNNTTLQVVVNHYNNDYTLTPGQAITITHPITINSNFTIISPETNRLRIQADGLYYSIEEIEKTHYIILNTLPVDVTLKDNLHDDFQHDIQNESYINILAYDEPHEFYLDGTEYISSSDLGYILATTTSNGTNTTLRIFYEISESSNDNAKTITIKSLLTTEI